MRLALAFSGALLLLLLLLLLSQDTSAGRGLHLRIVRTSRRPPRDVRVLGFRPPGQVPRVGRARRRDR